MSKKRKPKKAWVYAPEAQKMPDHLKAELGEKANELIETVLKSRYVKPPPKNRRINYAEEIYTKWHQSRFFYFCARYRSPLRNGTSTTFEVKIARMAHMGNGCFNLSYMRHTGQWWQLYTDLTIDECLERIRDEPHFSIP
jgi:hypothetical protein